MKLPLCKHVPRRYIARKAAYLSQTTVNLSAAAAELFDRASIHRGFRVPKSGVPTWPSREKHSKPQVSSARPVLVRFHRGEKRRRKRVFGTESENNSLSCRLNGGESGIRTHVRVSPKHAFQACAFSHSAISPAQVGTHSLYRHIADRLKAICRICAWLTRKI